MGTNGRTERVTLARVAKEAGVAESTASRVLNGYTENFRVRPEVRQRVLDAATSLNYKPNPMIRSISAKRTNLVAVVGWASDGVNRRALSEAVRLCSDAGKHVCTTFLRAESTDHELPSWRVDGAIALQIRVKEDLAELEASGLPYVSINGLTGPDGDAIVFDDAGGMDLLIEHLCALGHTKIAYMYIEQERVNPRGLAHASVATRRAAYAASMNARGLEPMPGCDRFDVSFADYIDEFVRAGRATALVVYDDIMALYALQAIHAAGLRVPDDLSVVTFNDELASRVAAPALTTVALPADEAGRQAAGFLLERLDLAPEDQPPSRTITLGQTLIQRASTAVPRP